MPENEQISIMAARFRGYNAGFYFQDVLEVVELRGATLKKMPIEGSHFNVTHMLYKDAFLPVLGMDFLLKGKGDEPYRYGLVFQNKQDRPFVVVGIGSDLELKHIPGKKIRLIPDYIKNRQMFPAVWGIGISDKESIVLADFCGIDLVETVTKLLQERR